MIIITVIFILALSLSGMTLSTRLQFNKTDEHNKATKLAEMGITYYQSIVNKFVSSANNVANQTMTDYINGFNKNNQPTDEQITESYNNSFKTALNNSLSSQPALTNQVEGSNQFEVDFKSLIQQSNKLLVNFTSKGSTGKDDVILTGTITIQSSNIQADQSGKPKPSPSAYSYIENNAVSGSKIPPYNTSTYFSQSVQLQGRHPLIINGNAYFSQDFSLQGATYITVYGDAIFEKGIIFQPGNGQPATICIYGNTYEVDSHNNLQDFPIPQNTCSQPQGRDWSIDMGSGINVQY